jgi:hypothetical protein
VTPFLRGHEISPFLHRDYLLHLAFFLPPLVHFTVEWAMLKAGLYLEIISQTTGLSKEEISSLKGE